MDEATTLAPPAPETRAEEVQQLPAQRRELQFRAETWNEEDRTIEVVFARGARVQRINWWTGKRYEEELSMDPEAVDLSRLNGGAQVLDSHMSYELRNIIGVVVDGSARIEDGAGIADAFE